jgi:hypothetical protein
MRTYTALCFLWLLYLTAQVYPQVPNGDFEQWAGGEPVGWWTNNFNFVTVTQSSDAHDGSSAVRGENIIGNDGVLQPLLISGIIGGRGFPVNQRYANLTGYYKFNAVGADNFNVLAAMYKSGQAIAVGGMQFYAASSYTQFIVPIYYSDGRTPDSCQISITIGNNTGPVNPGSYFLADDLSFQGTVTGVEVNKDKNTYSFALNQNYPNPFNPSTNLPFDIGQSSFVSLKVYDVLGREVSTLINEYKQAGHYEVNWYASEYPGGVYFYRLQAGSLVQVKKMTLIK